VKARATITKNNKAPKRFMYEPYDAIAFHPANASGKSGMRRGIPAKPRKCIGAKVTFAPIKVIQKCIFPNVSEYGTPMIFSNQ
jgi:hypothetical protein